ncbi:uncharacterized protein LOC103167602 [Ornithorhynchus anatinus]|uniref:uncharacterized protein LOC103167602 n=1 Tax=Ornithorhynchus anatinus TaxID=9258 RepID=UPI0010A94B9B|nr:uncharacterized protein LOC103167602 [Ornithorhynchus anatinus]
MERGGSGRPAEARPEQLKPRTGLKRNPKKNPSGGGRASWGKRETDLLLEVILKTGKARQTIPGTGQRNNALWGEIAEALARHQLSFTPKQCRTKWKHLKSQFRSEQAFSEASGAHGVHQSPFYEKMEALWKMEAVSPVEAKRPRQQAGGKPARRPPKDLREHARAFPALGLQPLPRIAANATPESGEGIPRGAPQQEPPAAPSVPQDQQMGTTMVQILEELRRLSRDLQNVSVVGVHISKILQCQQEHLIPGIQLLNHNVYQLCLLFANQGDGAGPPGPCPPHGLNPDGLLWSDSPVPEPRASAFEAPDAPRAPE